MAPSLGLPDWTLNLVLILLCAGFIIAVLLSWIYDINPEGSMVKTEPPDKVKSADIKQTSNSWRIASYISFAVIIGLVILNIIPRSGKKEILDKSIAVLPFINDSPEEEGMYFINGTMESVLDNLCKIKDLRVVSRTSVEQYRNNLKPVQEIGRDMNVAYILQGSGLKHGNKIRLTLQLIEVATDSHIWSDSYNTTEEKVFDLYSDVAQLVASEIKAIVTTAEKELIEKVPTVNPTALDLYQKAMEEPTEKAKELLYYSLEYDSTFAWPYSALATIYRDRFNQNRELFSQLKDSVVRLTDKALHFDPQLASAHLIKGSIYRDEGKPEKAISSYKRAIQLNPNFGEAYNALGWFYFDRMDYVNAIENLQMSILRDRTPDHLRTLYDVTGFVFSFLGFPDLSTEYHKEALKWHGDTALHILRLAQVEQYKGNYQKAIDLAQIAYKKDSSDSYQLVIFGENYQLAGLHEESFYYFSKYVDFMDRNSRDIPWHKIPIACSYLNTGHIEMAEYLIEQQIRQAEEWIESGRVGFEERYWYLAMAYALKQDIDRVVDNLKEFLGFQTGITIHYSRTLENPIFYAIKDDPEFMELCDTLKARYEVTHERVRQWLAENDIL